MNKRAFLVSGWLADLGGMFFVTLCLGFTLRSPLMLPVLVGYAVLFSAYYYMVVSHGVKRLEKENASEPRDQRRLLYYPSLRKLLLHFVAPLYILTNALAVSDRYTDNHGAKASEIIANQAAGFISFLHHSDLFAWMPFRRLPEQAQIDTLTDIYVLTFMTSFIAVTVFLVCTFPTVLFYFRAAEKAMQLRTNKELIRYIVLLGGFMLFLGYAFVFNANFMGIHFQKEASAQTVRVNSGYLTIAGRGMPNGDIVYYSYGGKLTFSRQYLLACNLYYYLMAFFFPTQLGALVAAIQTYYKRKTLGDKK